MRSSKTTSVCSSIKTRSIFSNVASSSTSLLTWTPTMEIPRGQCRSRRDCRRAPVSQTTQCYVLDASGPVHEFAWWVCRSNQHSQLKLPSCSLHWSVANHVQGLYSNRSISGSLYHKGLLPKTSVARLFSSRQQSPTIELFSVSWEIFCIKTSRFQPQKQSTRRLL